MKQAILFFSFCFFYLGNFLQAQPIVASRLLENFDTTTLVSGLSDPWEITYGKDNYLWVTEARGYRVRRIHPTTGAMDTVLDISSLKNFPRYDKIPNGTDGGKPWPQGGLMGLAMHPDFIAGKPYVYLTYVHTFAGAGDPNTSNGCLAGSAGCFFTSRIVRYEYDFGNRQLINPVTLVDTIPGSSDHNSGRMLIAPVSGFNYLFSSVGDMGGGQFANGARQINSQVVNIYEGKILRFNLEPDADAGTYDRWIPNDNPFNGAVQSAVWTLGHRNPQGLTYARINNTDFIFAAEHGPFSDDEVNIIERGKNYGHPLVIGSNDGNYDNAAAGASSNASLPNAHNSSAPIIPDENANVNAIGVANFRGPIKAFFSPDNTALTTIFNAVIGGNNSNANWPSEGISSIAYYGGTGVPNWYNSLFISTLKGGKVIRMKLNPTGTGFVSLAGADTVGYFRSVNRFRDIAFSPDGSTVFAVIDSSSITSGPTMGTPQVSVSRGSILKFTYLNGGILSVRNRDSLLANKKAYQVHVFPNPTNKFIIVNFEIGVHKPVEYRLMDMTGKLVIANRTNQNSFSIAVGHLKRGVYILKLYNGYGVEVKMEKMIIQ